MISMVIATLFIKKKNNMLQTDKSSFLFTGLIIASHVQAWMDNFNSLRLSQILDMYYTDEGINLLNENVKVCDRGKAFSHVAPKLILSEQVSSILYHINANTLNKSTTYEFYYHEYYL